MKLKVMMSAFVMFSLLGMSGAASANAALNAKLVAFRAKVASVSAIATNNPGVVAALAKASTKVTAVVTQQTAATAAATAAATSNAAAAAVFTAVKQAAISSN